MKTASLCNPGAIDEDGLLADVDVQSIDDVPPTRSMREDKRRDVDHFFHAAFTKVVDGKSKRYCTCKPCP